MSDNEKTDLVPVLEAELVTADALTAITRSEVDMQVSTARRYPRSISMAKTNARAMIELDRDMAQQCWYQLQQGGKQIVGPSVRLAEIVLNCWGNLRVEARVVAEGDKTVTAQGTAWDMEMNTLVRIEKQRRITTREGKRYGDDMVTKTANAAAAIAKREAVFNIVPKPLVMVLMKHAMSVAAGDKKTLPAKRTDALKQFADLGVDKRQVYQLLGVPGIDDINAEHLITLWGILTAVTDGELTLEEAFGANQTVADRVRAKVAAQEQPQALPPVQDAPLATQDAPGTTTPPEEEPAPQTATQSAEPPEEEPPPPLALDGAPTPQELVTRYKVAELVEIITSKMRFLGEDLFKEAMTNAELSATFRVNTSARKSDLQKLLVSLMEIEAAELVE